jgi:hypothetical protein
MSNQEPQNQDKTKAEAGVEKRRRFIKGAGVAAPVVLTLSSPSVFGALCASELASGNESHTGTGSCVEGASPSDWSNPNGTVGSLNTIDAWKSVGFLYGKKKKTNSFTSLSKSSNDDDDKQDDSDSKREDSDSKQDDSDAYKGGTTFVEVFSGGRDKRTLREILLKGNQTDKNLVAAMLNAKYFKNYSLTPAQVQGLYDKTFPLPPGINDINALIESTY